MTKSKVDLTKVSSYKNEQICMGSRECLYIDVGLGCVGFIQSNSEVAFSAQKKDNENSHVDEPNTRWKQEFVFVFILGNAFLTGIVASVRDMV